MVLIRFDRDEAGRLAGFSARGHALFAEEGSDVVCAGVSSLLLTAILGLERVVRVAPRYAMTKGRLTCSVEARHLDGDSGRQVEVLLETILLGLQEMAQQYPEHARVQEHRTRPRDARRRRAPGPGETAGGGNDHG